MSPQNLKTMKGKRGRSKSLCVTQEELREASEGEPRVVESCEPGSSHERSEIIPPDGGWGWLVAAGGSCNHGLAAILVPTFSLIFSSFFIKNDVSSTLSTWIFNINQCLWNVGAFLGGPLCSRYGWRKVAFGGGLCLSISVIMAGFVTKPELLFLTFSVFTGVGQGLCVMISFVTVSNYFDKKKGVATGMVSAGNCLGQFFGPLLVRHLMENYGRQGTNLILGGILFHSCAIALTFHPVEWHSNERKLTVNEQNEIQYLHGKDFSNKMGIKLNKDLEQIRRLSLRNGSISTFSLATRSLARDSSSFPLNILQPFPPEEIHVKQNIRIRKLICDNLLLLKWHRVQIMTVSVALAVSSYVNFLMLIPFAMTEKGHSLDIISWCLSLAGICNFIARLVVTSLTDIVSFSAKYFFMVGSFGIFLSIIIFSLVSSSPMVLLTMSFFGLSVGTCICLLSIISLEFMGLKFLAPLLGLNGLLIATAFLILGPILGAIRDATDSYFFTLQILSLAPLLSFSLWFLMPYAISLDRKRVNHENEIR